MLISADPSNPNPARLVWYRMFVGEGKVRDGVGRMGDFFLFGSLGVWSSQGYGAGCGQGVRGDNGRRLIL